jgi:hypothetical protein
VTKYRIDWDGGSADFAPTFDEAVALVLSKAPGARIEPDLEAPGDRALCWSKEPLINGDGSVRAIAAISKAK